MKVVWIINHYANYGYSAGSSRHFFLAKELIQYGWQSYIFSASTTLKESGKTENKTYKCNDSVFFQPIYATKYKGNSFGRYLNMIMFAIFILFPKNHNCLKKPDIIIGSTVHPLAAFSAFLLSKKYRTPFIFEVRDLWPLTLIEFGRLKKNNLVTKLLLYLEKKLCEKSEKIISLLPGFELYAQNIGVDANKVEWLSNGVDVDLFKPAKKRYRKDEKFTVMYMGAHGNANDLDTLLDAMKILGDRHDANNIVCRLIGDGTRKSELKRKVKQQGISNVAFEPAIPKVELEKFGREADVFVICVRDLPELYRYGISMNKLFDYMAMSRPIIIASGAMNNPIEDAKCGVTVQPEDSSALAKAIFDLSIRSEDELSELGKRARSHVENYYNYSFLGKKLSELLDASINESQ